MFSNLVGQKETHSSIKLPDDDQKTDYLWNLCSKQDKNPKSIH